MSNSLNTTLSFFGAAPQFFDDYTRPFPVLVRQLRDTRCKNQSPHTHLKRTKEDPQQDDRSGSAKQGWDEERYLVVRHDETGRDGVILLQEVDNQQDNEHGHWHKRGLTMDDT